MNYLELQNECASALERAGVENFRNESRWLILETLQISSAVLYSSAAVPEEQILRIRQLCSRRCQHEPLQYILGTAPFAELELKVDPGVLIPRSETVCLVEYILDKIPYNGTLLDVGCGSGAIALLAASRRKDITVSAVDKSPEALKTAQDNAAMLELTSRVKFIESDLLNQLPGQKFDVIAANLPYVTFDEYALLADDVIEHFPETENITVCVDSSLILYDGWHESAVNLWKTPQEISDRLTTDNIVLDSLTALYKKRGDSVKILFDCSYRDDTLLQYQSYIDNGMMDNTKELGDRFQIDLKEMVEGLQTNIPSVGIYIWDYGKDEETGNTQHTIISSNVFDKLGNDISVCEWIYKAVNGDVQTIGLELLE